LCFAIIWELEENIMEYRIKVVENGSSAKNKGIITGRWYSATDKLVQMGKAEIFTLEARDHDEAFRLVSQLFRPSDKRPVAGKSYIYKCALKPRKLGQKVKTVKPYAQGETEGHLGYREGVVTEIVSNKIVSVGFPGYRTQFVDFHLSELE
jgi:hypothetical protein